MLTLVLLGEELYDETTETFSTVGDITIELEHSLVSLSKWESEFEKSFLDSANKTPEEIFSYVRCMIITPDVPKNVLLRLSNENIGQVNAYIDSRQSATIFGTMPEHKTRGDTITSELIYYWMIAFNVPFECQYWHLNRLFALIRICNIKNSKPKSLSRHELATRNQALNAERRARLGTTG